MGESVAVSGCGISVTGCLWASMSDALLPSFLLSVVSTFGFTSINLRLSSIVRLDLSIYFQHGPFIYYRAVNMTLTLHSNRIVSPGDSLSRTHKLREVSKATCWLTICRVQLGGLLDSPVLCMFFFFFFLFSKKPAQGLKVYTYRYPQRLKASLERRLYSNSFAPGPLIDENLVNSCTQTTNFIYINQ